MVDNRHISPVSETCTDDFNSYSNGSGFIQHRRQDASANAIAAAAAPPDEEAVAILEGEQQERDRLSRLFPNSWHTADVKHVVDNLLHECLQCMSTPPAFIFGHFRALLPFVKGYSDMVDKSFA